MILNKFYPIFENYNWLKNLLPIGIKFVQLRIKNQPVEVIREEVKKAQILCRR